MLKSLFAKRYSAIELWPMLMVMYNFNRDTLWTTIGVIAFLAITIVATGVQHSKLFKD